jgi:general secretion pathway protein A
MVRYHLDNMTQEETEGYLRHRLAVACGEGPSAAVFDRGAVKEIYRYSRGTPRLINAIGDKSLLAGYVYRTACIDRGIVRIAVEELREAC